MVAVRIPGPEGVNYVAPAKDPGQRLATGQDFGSQIGAELAQMGNVISSLGNAAGRLQKERQGEVDRVGRMTYLIDRNKEMDQQFNDAQANVAPGAQNFYSTLQSTWTKDQEKRLGDFQTKYGVSKDGMSNIKLEEMRLQADYGGRAVAYEHNESIRFQGQKTDENISSVLNGAAAHGGFANAQKVVNEAITGAGRVFSPDQEQKVREEARKGTVQAFGTWAGNVAAKGFADDADLQSKWQGFETELGSLDLTDGEKDLLRQKYGSDFAKGYAQQHPEQAPVSKPQTQGKFTGDYYARLAQVESSGDPNAFNKDSGAAGPYQFIPSTARQYGLPADARQASAEQQTTAVKKLTEDNRSILRQKLGRDPSPGELYLAHQQGAQGAANLLTNPGELAVNVVGEKAVQLNGGSPGMTAQQFADKWISKFEGASTPSAAGRPTTGPFQYMTADTWQDWQSHGEAKAKQDYSNQLNALLVDIHDGNAGQQDIAAARGSWLTDYEDINKADKALENYTQETGAVRSVADRIAAGNGTYDPTEGSSDTKAINKLYESTVKPGAVAEGDAQSVASTFATWRETGIMPKQAKGELAGMLRSKDVAKITTGLSYLDAIERDRPDAFQRSFDENTQKQLTAYRENLDYASPAEIADRIKQSADPATRKAREALKKEIKPEVDKLTFDDLSKQFDGSWRRFVTLGYSGGINEPFTPEQRTIMLEDYKSLLSDQYSESGNMDFAKREAMGRLQRVWGVSGTNGNRLMKRPPEMYAQTVDGSHDWMAPQVNAALDELGYYKDAATLASRRAQEGVVRQYPQYGLVTDPQTEAEISAGSPTPTWQLWVVDENGMPDRAMGKDGRPARMWFDRAPAVAASKLKLEQDRKAFEKVAQPPGKPGSIDLLRAPAEQQPAGEPSATGGGGPSTGVGASAMIPPGPGSLDTLRAPGGIPEFQGLPPQQPQQPYTGTPTRPGSLDSLRAPGGIPEFQAAPLRLLQTETLPRTSPPGRPKKKR